MVPSSGLSIQSFQSRRYQTPCGHHDRHVVADAAFAHHCAQFRDAGVRVLRRAGIFGVGQAVMPAGEPGVLIDHRRQPFRRLRIGALPQGAEGAARTDDGQVADAVGRRDLAELVGHASAAGHTRDHAARPLQHAVKHPLRAAHFPKHVDVDRTLAVRNFERALHLLHRALDRIGDQFLVPLTPGQRLVDLGDDLALGVIAVGVDRTDRSDAARSGHAPADA